MGITQIYRSLNAEQKQIIDTKSVDLNQRIDELLALLQPVAACDQAVGKNKTSMGCTLAFCVVAAIVSIFLLSSGVGFVTLPLAIIGFFISLHFYRFAAKIDVSDNLGGFAVPMLKLLRDDFNTDEPVHVTLDLRQPTAKEKLVSVSDPYKQGAYYKIIDTIYKDPWFSGEALLRDGSRFRWSIEDTIRESKKSKKTPRGKYKTKTKFKKKSSIDVELVLKKKTYAVEGAAKETEKGNVMRATRKYIHPSNEPIPLDPLVELMGGIYKAARPAQ